MLITPSIEAPSGLAGILAVTIYDGTTLLPLLPRTVVSITETEPDSGIYTWRGSIPDATLGWIALWDDGGAFFNSQSYGNAISFQAATGLVGTASVEIYLPDETVLVSRGTAHISELAVGSGVYGFNGPIPASGQTLIVASWFDGSLFATDEIIWATPSSTTITPSFEAATGLLGTLTARIINAVDQSIVLAETTAGINELGTTGGYVLTASIPSSLLDYVVVWNDNGNYAVEGFGNALVLQSDTGLPIHITVLNPDGNVELVSRTNAVVELVPSSGIYLFTGTVAYAGQSAVLAVWDDNAGAFAEEEIPWRPPSTTPPPVTLGPTIPRVAWKVVGPPNTPQEVRRLRREVMDLMRRYGQPTVWKHMFNQDDLEQGYTFSTPQISPTVISVKRCPACFDSDYQATRGDCTVCYSTSYVSVQVSDTDYINAADYRSQPGDTDYADARQLGVKAPKYGGFGPAFLTWIVQPDVPTDVFRINDQGTFIQTINGQGIAPWYPEMGDNDLMVDVSLALDGFTVTDEGDRWQLKMTNPVTLRGWGRRNGGQLHKVNQSFEMSHIPEATKIIWQKIPLNV